LQKVKVKKIINPSKTVPLQVPSPNPKNWEGKAHHQRSKLRKSERVGITWRTYGRKPHESFIFVLIALSPSLFSILSSILRSLNLPTNSKSPFFYNVLSSMAEGSVISRCWSLWFEINWKELDCLGCDNNRNWVNSDQGGLGWRVIYISRKDNIFN
jgi:hypothetical protein